MSIYMLNLAVHLCIGKVYLLLLLNVEKMVGILPNSITFIRIVLDIQIYNTLLYSYRLQDIFCFIKEINYSTQDFTDGNDVH